MFVGDVGAPDVEKFGDVTGVATFCRDVRKPSLWLALCGGGRCRGRLGERKRYQAHHRVFVGRRANRFFHQGHRFG